MTNLPDGHFDLVTIGDSTIDTFIKIHDASIECDINHEQCKICIAYGSKIPVDSIAHSVAGNAANVVIGCAKLGLYCGIYTNLGDDDYGKTIKETLKKANIAEEFIKVNSGCESNLSVVLTFQGERTIFVYHQPWQYLLPDLANTSWVYLTSMAQSFVNSNIMQEIDHFVDKSKSKLVFSPGTYQLKADIKRYPRLLERCQVLIVNMEEAKKILKIPESETIDPRDLLNKLLLLGPKIVVVTDGEEGSWSSDGERYLKAGILARKLVEKTGAGDAYASGFISALFYDQPLEEAMIWGTINAASVIGKIGPQNGLLTESELKNERLKVPELSAVSV